MIRNFTMTGAEIAINLLHPGVANLGANDLDNNGITEAFGKGYKPEIMFKAAEDNIDAMYITENSGDPANYAYRLLPGVSLTMDFNTYVKTMNEFFVSGTAGDLLSVIVR